MSLKLIKLTKEDEALLTEMLEEWREDIEKNQTNHSPYAIFRNDYHDFDYYLEHLETKETTPNRVADSVWFLLDEQRHKLLGAVNIRHHLNESLRYSAGHIGDGIRPSERRKGYATKMIGLALEKCRELHIEQVLMNCDKDNIGSRKSILNNGGVLDSEFINEEGTLEQRYWIDLTKYKEFRA